MKRNLGLTAKQKLFLQFLLAGAYVYYLELQPHVNLGLNIPGTSLSVPLGSLYYVLAFLLLVGTTNAVNLTDGLDGLAASVTVPVTLAYAYIAYQSGSMDLSIFALTLTGACLGFLLFNRYPAKVFMGDTGSLALGGGIGCVGSVDTDRAVADYLGWDYVMERFRYYSVGILRKQAVSVFFV